MSRHAYHDHLKQIPLFEDLDHEDLDLLAEAELPDLEKWLDDVR